MPGEIESETRGIRLPGGRRLALESIPIDSNIVYARKRRKITVPEEYVLVLGLCMMSWGIYSGLYWWIMGGFLVFFLAIEAMPSPEEKHADAETNEEATKTPGH